MDRLLGAVWLIFVVAWIYFAVSIGIARGQYHNCTEFGFAIPHACCCTANCCTEAEAGEFAHYGNDQYRSTVTGQVVARSGWSPDGRTIKCACSLVGGVWTKLPTSRVSCLFPPMPSS